MSYSSFSAHHFLTQQSPFEMGSSLVGQAHYQSPAHLYSSVENFREGERESGFGEIAINALNSKSTTF